MNRLIDTHCHLTHPRLRSESEAVVRRAREAGVAACVSIGTGVEDARRVLELTERFPSYVFGTAGLDPFTAHDAGDSFEDALQELSALLAEGGLQALGEVGLDYHYDLDPRPVQRERFARQLELAESLDLPVVIHVRDAHDDMVAVLREHPGNRGVIHSFTAGPELAESYLALGWHLAFNGVLTFKRAEELREAARVVPADRLLLETDSPYLAPVPLRGKRCEPALMIHTLELLAQLRGEERESLAQSTSANARRLFGMTPTVYST